MELEQRPHRQAPSTTTPTSDLFICFSSMRLTSKSIVSPGRTDKPPISLSASLSRRLRSKNGSLKGGQSPMFPPGVSSKKRGGCAAIDNNNNPEPSSPKVTCIGQVRVKTKKHGKKMKMNMSRAYRARRSASSSGDMRGEGDGCLQHRNQRWVHLPVTICDALKGFGSEFNCFSPCRSSCFSGSEVKERRGRGRGRVSKSSGCCGSVCRWFVALHEGEGKRRDVELVVREEEGRGVERVVMERECSRRRSIFDDVDFNIDEICEVGNEIGGEAQGDEEVEEAARVSICVPPKNALLLMRCRSDPVKMSALSSKFWESPPKNQQRDDDQEGEDPVEEIGRRRSSVSERVKVESLLSFAEEETGRRRSSVSERIKFEPFSISAEEAGRKRSSVSERVKIEALSSSAEEETGMRSSVSERIKFEPLSISAEEAGRRRSSVSERVKFEALSCSAEEEIGRRRSSASERIKVKSLSGSAEETGRRSSVSERVKIEALSSSAEGEENQKRPEAMEQIPENTQPQLEIDSEKPEMDGELVQEEKIQKQRFSIDSKDMDHARIYEDEVMDLGDGKEEKAIEEVASLESAPPLKEYKEENFIENQQAVVEKGSSFEQEEDEQQPLEDESMEEEVNMQEKEEEEESGLPDCLLLMMCEPKVSMEVSKETWVCSTDFIRWLPERHRQHHLKKINPKTGGDEATKKKKKKVAPPPPPPAAARLPPQPPGGLQPPRSSCSFPTAGVKEKKLVNSAVPFVLTRCKSEPMRSASAKLGSAPELACFWKNRKIEPHRPATCGVGAAGVGC